LETAVDTISLANPCSILYLSISKRNSTLNASHSSSYNPYSF
jgi:hypothetical protein